MKNNSKVIWGAVVVVVIIVIVWYAGQSTSNQAMPTGNTPVVSNNVTGLPATAGKTSGTSASKGTTSAIPSPNGYTFRLTKYDNTTVPTGDNYLLSFSGNKLSGGVCNNIVGSYSVNNGALTTNLGNALGACQLNADMAPADQLVHTVLGQVAAYSFAGNTLTIFGNGHTLVFNIGTK